MASDFNSPPGRQFAREKCSVLLYFVMEMGEKAPIYRIWRQGHRWDLEPLPARTAGSLSSPWRQWDKRGRGQVIANTGPAYTLQGTPINLKIAPRKIYSVRARTSSVGSTIDTDILHTLALGVFYIGEVTSWVCIRLP